MAKAKTTKKKTVKSETKSDKNTASQIKAKRKMEEEILSNIEKDPLYQEILEFPKTDLHCHLDGSLRISTIIELLQQDGMPYPVDEKALRKLVVKDDQVFSPTKSLVEYLKAFEVTTSVMQTAPAIERIAYELAIDAASENVRYLEVRFAPILHTNKGLSLDEITSAVSRGLSRAESEVDIICGIIICAMRHYVPCQIQDNLLASLPYSNPKEASFIMAMQTAKHTVKMAQEDHHIVGFDIAGGEVDNPAKDYREAFYEITNGLVPITVHAGEAVGPESILEAVNFLHVKRIGHGTNLYKDPLLISYFKNERIPLEVCLTSNLQTCENLHAYSEHPLKHYIDNRIRTTICTDNRLVSNTTVTRELAIAAKLLDLDMDHIKVLIMHGFNSVMHNAYYPESENAYNAMRELRSKVEKEIKYRETLTALNKRYVAGA